MDDCEKLKYWHDLLPSEKLELIQNMVARMADDFGLDVPHVMIARPPDVPETPEDESDYRASYNPVTGELRISPSTWSNYDDVADEAGHEVAHGVYRDLFGADDDAGSDEWRKDSEDFADSFGDIFGDMLERWCQPPPPQSPGKSDGGTGDWNLPDPGTAVA